MKTKYTKYKYNLDDYEGSEQYIYDLLREERYRVFNATEEIRRANEIKKQAEKEIKILKEEIDDLRLEVKELKEYNRKYTYKFPMLFISIKKLIKNKVANW